MCESPNLKGKPVSGLNHLGVVANLYFHHSLLKCSPMNDENLIHVAPETVQPGQTNNNSDHALVGKIARLPHDIREQLNQRLLDGLSGTEILPWLNELPAVKEILRAQFDGVPIHKQNLTVWRQGGFQRWLRERRRVSTLKERCQYAAQTTPSFMAAPHSSSPRKSPSKPPSALINLCNRPLSMTPPSSNNSPIPPNPVLMPNLKPLFPQNPSPNS
jgi:hypothetical protein